MYMNKSLVTGLFVVIIVGLSFYISRHSEERATTSSMNASTAIESIKARFPEFGGYPSDNLPPTSIKTEEAVDGWYVAFIQEGSGRPIILAKCYFIDNTKKITSVGVYSPKYSDYSIEDISPKNCQPR